MKKLFLLLIGIGFTASVAEARPAYYAQLLSGFPHNRIEATTRCMTCHDGRKLNPFGLDFVELVQRSSVRPFDFAPLRGIDSDGDGRTNEEEILAGTNPGKRDAPVENLLIEASFSCSCHALDSSNPFNEIACNGLQVGTTCGRVGNIICIPRCQ